MVVAVLWQGLGTAVVGAAVPPELSTFTTFAAFLAAAVLAGAAYRARRRRAQTRPPELPLRDALAVNLVTAGAFSAFYVAATLIPATAASVLETGLGPFVIALVMASTARRAGPTLIRPALVRPALVQPTLVLLLSAAIAYLALSLIPGSGQPGRVVLGLGLSILAGVCAAGVLLSSHRLSTRGVSALQIGAARFHLAWVLSGALALPTVVALATRDPDALWSAAMIGVGCITAPILLLQWGITIARPLHAALVIAALPAVVLAGDVLLTGAFQPALAAGMVVLVALSILGVRRAR